MADQTIAVGCAGAGTLKDLAMVGDMARAGGAVMPVTSLVEQLYRKLVADGLGERDNTEFVRLYRDAD